MRIHPFSLLLLFCVFVLGGVRADSQATSTHTVRLLSQEWAANDQASLLASHAAALDLLPERHRKELVVLSESLRSVISKDSPFCSGRLATLLQRCTTDTLDTDTRDEAAVFLTLCDRSRDYAAPMECEGLAKTDRPLNWQAVKRCATALDQHQNFQRAFDVYRLLIIPEKCKSLNTVFNVDPLKAVYQNITLDLLSFLHSFTNNEIRSNELFERWESYLKEFRDSTANLDLAKESLIDFNKLFVANLSDTIDTFNDTFVGLSEKALRDNDALSSDFKDQLMKLKDEHTASLASALTSLTTYVSSGLDRLFNDSAQRQQSFDVAVSLAVNQMTGTVYDLAVARQEFEILSNFIKESTSKAYNQALLLDSKQLEVSDSLTGLSLEIKSLTKTTRELNTSMADISASTHEYRSSSWLSGHGWLSTVLKRLDMSSYVAVGFVIFVLPRFLLETAVRTVAWFAYALASFLLKLPLGRRKFRKAYDPEKNTDSTSLVVPRKPSDNNYEIYSPSNDIPTPAVPSRYETISVMQQTETRRIQYHPVQLSSRVLYHMEHIDWTHRSRTHFSRLPARLYRHDLYTDKLSQYS